MDINQLIKEKPVIRDMADCKKEIFWINPRSDQPASYRSRWRTSRTLRQDWNASGRIVIAVAFPETSKSAGIIESELTEIPRMKERLVKMTDKFWRSFFLKRDSDLPVSARSQARGGIYEVLKFAGKIALEKGMLHLDDNYAILTEERFRDLFSQYSVAVGSTGNLGLSIGIISAKLGLSHCAHVCGRASVEKRPPAQQRRNGNRISKRLSGRGRAGTPRSSG